MIVIRGKDIEAKDWGELVGIGPIGLKIKWLIHNGVGDDSYGHRFALREFIVEPGQVKPLPAHQHKYVEAVYVISGKAIFKGETGEEEVGPGDVIYTYSNELHSSRIVENGGREPLRIICCIDCVDGGENCSPEMKGITVKD